MIHNNILQHLGVGPNQQFLHPANSTLGQNRTEVTSITYTSQSANLQGNLISEGASIPSGTVISQPRALPQRIVNVPSSSLLETNVIRTQLRPVSEVIVTNNNQTIQNVSEGSRRNLQEQNKKEVQDKGKRSSVSFDPQKEELKQEVRRLQGLLKKNQTEIEIVRKELTTKNQALIEFERRVSSGEQNKTKFNVHIKTLEDENLKLKSMLERMNSDRQNITKSHQKYMKSDEAVRTQIFQEVQKLQRVIQQKTKQVQESKQRQLIITKQFQAFRNQAGNQLNEGERNTVHLMQKLKVALQGKQLQIQSLNQAIRQLDNNLSISESTKSQQTYLIRSLEAQVIQLRSQNQNLKQYQSHRHELTFDSQVNVLRAQTIELQRSLDVYREREKEIISTYVGDKSTEKDIQITKLRAALQDNESNQLTLQYLSKEIHNYRLIIQDLESYKENGYKKDIEITRLHQTVVAKEKELIELQNIGEEIKGKLKNSQIQYRSIRETSGEQIRQLEQKCVVLNQKISVLETEKVGMTQVSSAQADIHINELTKALDISRNEYFTLRKVTDEKIFELETIRGDLEGQIRSITQVIEQKEGERQFFQQQYKELYTQFIESKKHSSDNQLFNDEIKELKDKLFHSREENNKLQIELKRILENDKGRDTFNTRQELSRVRGIIENHNNPRKQEHHRQTQSMNGLREENEHLKELLEDARVKIEEYSNDLEECQQRMISFQDRMQNLLSGGNINMKPNYQHEVYEQKQMMDQVVNELRSKLKLFKKQNDQLKKKVKESKEENRRNRQSDKYKSEKKSKDLEQIAREEFIKEKKEYEHRLLEISSLFDAKENRITELVGQNQQLNEQIASIEEVNSQNLLTLKQYETSISQYEKAMNRYEARIKEYQNTMLKIKHKYKEEAILRVPEPEIERPTNTMQNVSERLEFFRAKSHEAEERVKQLLKINNQLKVQLEQTSSLIGGENLQTQKIQVLQDSIAHLEKKLMQATQESLELKARVETVDDNPNLSSILELKMRQLLEQNSELRVQISQATSEIVSLKQSQVPNIQPEGGNDLLKLQVLQRKFLDLNNIIYTLQSEKHNLIVQNDELRSQIGLMGRSNISGQNVLLQQISNLQQEVYQLKVANRELQQIQVKQPEYNTIGSVSLDTYSTLMIEVDKIIQMTDGLNVVFSNIIDDVAKSGSQQLKVSIDGMVVEAVDIFRRIDVIKYSVGGLRQQSETATVIHEINQLI